jgi:hypothetical protein
MIAIYASILTGITGWAIGGVEFFMLVPIGALLVAFICILLIPFKRTRDNAFKALSVTGVVTIMFPILIIFCMKVRMFGFYLATIRAEPLISAINQYNVDHKSPPNTLDELVPDYIEHIPSRLPDFNYTTGTNSMAKYHGNEWALDAPVSSGIINWDRFMYFPNKNYPDRGYGGNTERIRDWAYVHE